MFSGSMASSVTNTMSSMSSIGGVAGNITNLAGMLTGNAQAQLVARDGFSLPLVFNVNPSSVKITKKNKTQSQNGVIQSSNQDAIKATGDIKLELGEAHVTGAGSTQDAADQLIEWTTPCATESFTDMLASAAGSVQSAIGSVMSVGRALGAQGGIGSGSTTKQGGTETGTDKPKYYQVPVLLFSWGLTGPRGSNLPVILESVTVDYRRFDPTGIPVWAVFTLTLSEYHEQKGAQNPTSGGLPGRSNHTVSQGENVVQIANRAYGSPQAWRIVAEANGMDDPLRVKPGRTLSLPPV